jgi:hypothetical protein
MRFLCYTHAKCSFCVHLFALKKRIILIIRVIRFILVTPTGFKPVTF